MKLFVSSFIVFLLMVFSSGIIIAQNQRPPKDSVGFAWTSVDMDRLMGYLNKNTPKESFPANGLVAGISPHDDYLYAGKVYYPLYKNIRAREFVIIGLTHGAVKKAIDDPKDKIILDNYDLWTGPYSTVKISPLREEIKNKLNPHYFTTNDQAQALEHSIEALLPFIQHYNREIRITPIMVTAMNFDNMETISEELSKIIAEYIDKKNLRLGSEIFFLISSDANHYGKDFNNIPYGEDEKAHKTATGNDKKFAESFLMTEINYSSVRKLTEELWNKEPVPVWCGRYSIPFGLLTVSKVVKKVTGNGLEGKIYKYSDTVTEGIIPMKNSKMGLTAPANFQHWCGWLSAGFYLK